MSENTLSAGDNAGLANDIIEKALADGEPKKPTSVVIKLPSDNLVDLPGGYITPAGEVVKTAEVRELNGFDEEAIAKSSTLGRVLNTIISRAVVKIGNEKATEEMLDKLFAGDRDALLVGIYSATFGNPAEVSAYCTGCADYITIGIDLEKEIETKTLTNPVEEQKFTITGRKHEYSVRLPDGLCQRELNSNLDKTVAELGSILLENTVTEIDGVVVYDKKAIKSIGLMDRREITKQLTDRNPGPQFKAVTVTCPTCEHEVVVPINLGVLFRV
jgi:hypothetical protein